MMRDVPGPQDDAPLSGLVQDGVLCVADTRACALPGHRDGRRHWPQLKEVQVRCHGDFAYVDGIFPDGYRQPLCRLRYGGSASLWGFAISKDGYEDSVLPDGSFAGTPEAALDCACLLLPQ